MQLWSQQDSEQSSRVRNRATGHNGGQSKKNPPVLERPRGFGGVVQAPVAIIWPGPVSASSYAAAGHRIAVPRQVSDVPAGAGVLGLVLALAASTA